MTDTILEHRWNPVNISGNSKNYNPGGGYGAASTSWYNQYMSSEGDRRTKLLRYNRMDTDSVEISRALDIIAEDISSCNADDSEAILIDYDQFNDTKVTKTELRLLRNMFDMWKERTKFEKERFNYAREAVKYGSIFFHKNKDGTLKKIQQEKVIGYIVSDTDDTYVTHYIIDDGASELGLEENFRRNTGTNTQNTYYSQGNNDKVRVVSVNDLVVIKLGTGPFGKSLLQRVYTTWRKLQLLEDAVVIYRVVRAPEKRAFYIDVGGQPPAKHDAVMKKYMQRLRQKQVTKNGDVSTEFDPHSATEDFFLPTHGAKNKGSRIETLQGGQQLGEMADVTWFARKLAAGLRVPPSMIDIQNPDGDNNQYSDMRVGQVFQQEIRYMGFIKRQQHEFEAAMKENFKEFSRDREYNIPEEFDLYIREPHSFVKYKQMELDQQSMNIYNSSTQAEALSERYAMYRFMHMDEEELNENEVMKLKEMGLDEKTISDMTEEEIHNLVYGDKRLGEKFGIKGGDDDGFGGGF